MAQMDGPVNPLEIDLADNSEYASQWAEIERLPTFERLKSSLFDKNDDDRNATEDKGKKMIDVTKLEALERHTFIEKLIKHVKDDNLCLLWKIRDRIDKVGVKLPTVEIRYRNLCVEAECDVVHGRPLPTLWNSLISTISDFAKLFGCTSHQAKMSIIDDVSGVIKSGRMTLLLGSPGCGKTSLLKALSGNLDHSCKVTGEVSYNGYRLEEFVPQKTSAYVSQQDMHMPEMTVRETLDFSARCQGVGSRADIMLEISRREKEAGIIPDPDIDTYMKATSVKGLKETLRTDYTLKILGLDNCAETLVGDAMRRGISGGQKKRLTTGEIIVGSIKTLFMDEITNGLDISTTFRIVASLQQLAHITNATILISLLQPSPETFNLFDDIIIMAEGKIVYHGPCRSALEFFEGCGFWCPERKAVPDFLLEVLSIKDQGQYWFHTEVPHSYVTVDMFSRKFKESLFGKKLYEDLSEPYDKSKSHKNALSFSMYSVSRWELFKACMSREFLLMKRNSFLYVFTVSKLVVMAIIGSTVFLRTQMDIDALHANTYIGALYGTLYVLVLDGFPEVFLTVARLVIFHKQKELRFYPAWAYAIPAAILKLPLSLVESLIWTSLTYYVTGYSSEFCRFFRQFILLSALHITSISIFRFVGSVFQTDAAAIASASIALALLLLFSGIVISRYSMPVWLRWGFWVSPFTYGEIGIAINEFLSPRWQKTIQSINTTIGRATLESRGLNFDGYFFWIALGALVGFSLIFNIGFTLALSFLKPSRASRFIMSYEKLSKTQKIEGPSVDTCVKEKPGSSSTSTNEESSKGRMILPFQPLTITFQDVQYYIDTPLEMKKRGFAQTKLQLLSDITGAFRPGILTALMGVTGAGKTTLLDVLAGRKTNGYSEGEIKINGYHKAQETFSRISGYCEQTNIHSPQITVEESLLFSAWLRLAPGIDSKTKIEFVNEVLETIELDGIKDSLVGIPGVSGLSTGQRKRLTIAVELVANPSIIFMDEPTSGLDSRAAAIVMRAVKNVADTGRTIVCTIHQPSIDIFEAFDELILLKLGGRVIYSGPLGHHSSKVIEYFEDIPGVPKIRDDYNPATWMLEVTSSSAEVQLGVDFAKIYMDSILHENNKELVRLLSTPPPGSSDLYFPTRFTQNGWTQFKSCLWKQHLSYWRSPSYNLTRIIHAFIGSLVLGAIYWNQGNEINNQQNLLNILGSLCIAVVFFGVNNCASILPYVERERTVMYRETFAGMYSSWAYALAQVLIEVPYICIQATIFTIITYPMIGYYGSIYKIFWYFYAIFCTLLYFNYMGMLFMSLTPNFLVAAILSAFSYGMLNLFSGFFIPQPQIPKWWRWFYYLTPMSWTINGLLTSQYGDIDKEVLVFGDIKTVAAFLKDYFGFEHDHLPISAIVLAIYPLVFASLFSYFVGRLNFQHA
ncbi:Pleiotropic drug resistance ABC transporter [Melia azedarach]|uniref:Pleiotropic drug resistance ABC transporter n=1 Tax=Melia azedarach TaxID=155640 RepID=A0ACC1YDH7_MELAZ|nr:Pleiotropic drug resistance ABC transporter [Melia azedarach]